MKRRTVIIGGVLLLAAYLATGVTFIRPGERAVIRRFGRVVDTPGPGLHIGLPWGIDRVDRIPVDLVRRVQVGYTRAAEESGTPAGQLVTGDHNLVNVQAVIQYAVRDDAIEDYLVQAAQADALIERAAESALTEWIASRKVDDALGIDKVRLNSWLEKETQRRIEPYRLGVRIQAASIGFIDPPDQVIAAFKDVTAAQTAIQTSENDARQKAEKMRRDTEAVRYALEKDTEAYVNERRQLAQAEADAFSKRLEQYRRLKKDNPDILAAIWWDQMGKLFTRLKANGRIDLLDHHLAGNGLDITIFPTQPAKP